MKHWEFSEGRIAKPTGRQRLVEYLGLEQNVTAASAVVFMLGLGEELWRKFLPKYMESLGAGTAAIGLFGTTKDFLDAIYQYPGGWLADRLGRRRSFLIFVGLASVGYVIYLISPSWPFVFLGLAFAMAWSSMASPAIFALIGDVLPRQRRALGFTLQSILKRVPMTLSPIVGGVLIARIGILAGVRVGLITTLILVIVTVPAVFAIKAPLPVGAPTRIGGVWDSFHSVLKRLLISDIIIRFCEGLAEVLIILYVTNVLGVGIARYGVLIAIQIGTAILVYIPSAKIADRTGRKPFVVATFMCFALYPLAITIASSFPGLVVAFIIGGLREIGEPSRKAMIVDFAEPHLRGRTVGLYYLSRSLAIAPAAAIGGLLWRIAPQTPFITAFIIGIAGTCVFAATVDERYAS